MPALGASLIVPLLGLVQARLRPGQTRAALATALIPLTLLPLMRHGRMAMLDGTQLSAMALIWWGLLSTGPGPLPGPGWWWVAGLGASGLLLLKAPVALPVLAVAVLLRWLDRALDRRGWWLVLAGLLLGLLPGMAWHGVAPGLERGSFALVMWGAQGLARLTATLDNHAGGPLVPLIQVLTGGWPWLPLWPFGLALAWKDRRDSAGRWVIGLSLMAALLVFPLRTQLPWYSLLLWPPFALACGPVLASLGQKGDGRGVPTRGIGQDLAGAWGPAADRGGREPGPLRPGPGPLSAVGAARRHRPGGRWLASGAADPPPGEGQPGGGGAGPGLVRIPAGAVQRPPLELGIE